MRPGNIKHGGLGNDHRLTRSDHTMSQQARFGNHAIWRLAIIGMPQLTPQVDQDPITKMADHLEAFRLRCVEMHLQPPMGKQRRKQGTILQATTIAHMKTRFSCHHGIGKQQQRTTITHPGIQRHVLFPAQPARLRHQQKTMIGQHICRQVIQRSENKLVSQNTPRPMVWRIALKDLVQSGGLPPIDWHSAHQRELCLRLLCLRRISEGGQQ